MHSNNDKNDRAQGSSSDRKGWVRSDKYEAYNGRNKELHKYAKELKARYESSKPDTQLSNTNFGSAGSSKGNGK